MVRLVCGHRNPQRRPVVVFQYMGTLPVPEGYQPRGSGATLELHCPYCGFAPRPGDAGLRLLLNAAAAQRDGKLDINPGRYRARPPL